MEVPLYELIVVLLIILFGGISAFLSAHITEIPQDTINDLLEDDYKTAQTLQNLRLQFEKNVSPFQILEISFYSVGGMFVGYMLYSNLLQWQYIGGFVLLYIAAVLVVRYLFQAIGIRTAETTATSLTFLFRLIHLLTKPICFVLTLMTNNIIGEKSDEDSWDEIEKVVESAYSDKALDNDEYKMLKNTINFGDVTVREVMTPRTVIFSANIAATINEMLEVPSLQNYSRFPVWEGESIDSGVQGYVMTRDLYHAALTGKGDTRLDNYVRKIRIVNETDTLDEVLERFIGSNKHISMVVDEYGGITGLITMEDVLESLIGEEIVDEADNTVNMRQLAKQRRDKKITQLE